MDGYLVKPNGRVRALAGGDVRYGGLYELLAVGRDHDSDRLQTPGGAHPPQAGSAVASGALPHAD